MRAAAPRLLACLALLGGGCAPQDVSGEPPDVLLIVIDTLRADHLSSYGFPFPTSPRIDRLAAEGVVFERAIAASASTVPSHAAMMSSKHVREINAGFATGEQRMQEPRPLASLFREAGYRTAAFVSNFALQRKWGFDRGFEVFDDELAVPEPRRPHLLERLADDTTRRALAWIARPDPRPFFAWVHYQDPHGPYRAPPPFDGRFELPPAAGERALQVLPGNTGLRGIPAYQAVDEARLPSRYRSRYADEVHYADHAIGALLDAVDARGPARGTVVLLTSDHGESFGEEGRWFVHGYSTTPEVAHVPLILRAPGLSAGRRSEPAGHVDVLPTLLELAGIEWPADARGLPLGRFAREGRPLPARRLYCDIGGEISAYDAGGFIRVRDIRGPASPREFAPDDSGARWERYAWEGGAWSLVDADLAPDAELGAFVRTAVAPRPMPLDGPTRERLRALGYLAE